MKKFDYIITDSEGIHARPAGLLVKKANEYTSAVKLGKSHSIHEYLHGEYLVYKRLFVISVRSFLLIP